MANKESKNSETKSIKNVKVKVNSDQVLNDKLKYFEVHRFIEENPNAVFIKQTNVPNKLDSEAKFREGIEFANEVFHLKDTPGIPITHKIVVKPNAFPSIASQAAEDGKMGYPGTQHNNTKYSVPAPIPERRPIVDTMGINTDVNFTEGIIRGMQEKLDLKKFYLRECRGEEDWGPRGWLDMAERVGANMTKPPADISKAKAHEVVYSDIPDGVMWKRIGHLAPTNEPDSWLLNIAKMKAHGMGMTQSCKNLQGLGAPMYVHMCQFFSTVDKYPEIVKKDLIPGYEERIRADWERHLKEGYPRWGVGSQITPLRLEIWSNRTLDHMSVTRPGLSIIEAIYVRNGDFMNGRDILTNLLIFGKNPVLLDIIGLWIGGHEPGNFGFHHIAVERGFAHTINPWDIPIYEFVEGKPHGPKDLAVFPRTPLVTYYLQRNDEPRFHLVNEAFDYEKWERKRKKEI